MKFLRIALICLTILSGFIGIILWVTAMYGYYNDDGNVIAIITLFSGSIVALSFVNQLIEKHKESTIQSFFKLIDCYNEMIDDLSVSHINQDKNHEWVYKKRCFIVFKIQLKYIYLHIKDLSSQLNLLLTQEEVKQIAVTILYHGIDEYNKEELLSIICNSDKNEKMSNKHNIAALLNKLLVLKETVKEKIRFGRTNMTSLSAYLQNLYHAVNLIDSDELLSKKEKQRYADILKAQLSAPELYIIKMIHYYLITPRNPDLRSTCDKFETKYSLYEALPEYYISAALSDNYKYSETATIAKLTITIMKNLKQLFMLCLFGMISIGASAQGWHQCDVNQDGEVDVSDITALANYILDPRIPLTGISLNEKSVSLKVNETKQLSCSFSPQDATNKNVVWESSDNSVVSVSNSGLMKALKAGQATVKVTSEEGGYVDNCNVTVYNFDITQYISMARTGTSISVTNYGTRYSVTFTIKNSSSETIHIVSLAGVTDGVAQDLKGGNSVSITLSGSTSYIQNYYQTLVYTYNGTQYSLQG